MKKTVVLLLLVLTIFTLAGCQEEGEEAIDTVNPVISGTSDITFTLGDAIPNWLDGVSALDETDGQLTVTVDDSDVDLETPGTYDLIYTATDKAGNKDEVIIKVFIKDPELESFYVELINFEGETLIEEIVFYDPTSETSLVQLIDEVVDLDYATYDFGTMINGIDGNYPKEYGLTYNFFYEIRVDDVASQTGIDLIPYAPGTKISFVETTYLSELDLKVDAYIYDFIENNISDFISEEFIDYSVLSAVHQLNYKGYIDIDLAQYYTYENLELVTEDISTLSISDLFRLGIYQSIENIDLTTYFNHLNTQTASNAYELITYLQAYHLNDQTNPNLATTLMDETFVDPDFVGLALLALDKYSELESFDTYLDSALTYIKSSMTPTGITSWGSANASSTAAIILGLVAQGINPQDEDYQVDGLGLVDMLMLYETNGVFKWTIDSTEVDLMFSTPQAFAALVAYKLARDVYGFNATNIYSF